MLTSFNTKIQEFSLMQSSWASQLNPLLSKLADVIKNQFFNTTLLSANILTNVSLANGTTEVPHNLNRVPTGWIIIRQRGNAIIYDNQDSETKPELFLKLVSTAAVSVDIYVF